jgi:hypothetical protein
MLELPVGIAFGGLVIQGGKITVSSPEEFTSFKLEEVLILVHSDRDISASVEGS